MYFIRGVYIRVHPVQNVCTILTANAIGYRVWTDGVALGNRVVQLADGHSVDISTNSWYLTNPTGQAANLYCVWFLTAQYGGVFEATYTCSQTIDSGYLCECIEY